MRRVALGIQELRASSWGWLPCFEPLLADVLLCSAPRPRFRVVLAQFLLFPRRDAPKGMENTPCVWKRLCPRVPGSISL